MFVNLDNKLFGIDKKNLSIFPGFDYIDDNLNISNKFNNNLDNIDIIIITKQDVCNDVLYNNLFNKVNYNNSIKNYDKIKKQKTRKIRKTRKVRKK